MVRVPLQTVLASCAEFGMTKCALIEQRAIAFVLIVSRVCCGGLGVFVVRERRRKRTKCSVPHVDFNFTRLNVDVVAMGSISKIFEGYALDDAW